MDGLYAIIAREPDKYPHKEGQYRLALQKRPKRAILIAALLDEANGYTTDAPMLNASSPSEARPTKSSKTRGSRRTTSQKAVLTQKAIDDGTMKSSALAKQLEDSGVQRAIPISVSHLHPLRYDY